MGQQMTPDTAKIKCKNFLATLLRLASDQPEGVAKNVRALIQVRLLLRMMWWGLLQIISRIFLQMIFLYAENLIVQELFLNFCHPSSITLWGRGVTDKFIAHLHLKFLTARINPMAVHTSDCIMHKQK